MAEQDIGNERRPAFRVLILSDDPLARSGLLALLGELSGISLTPETISGEAASRGHADRADIALWDWSGLRPASRERLRAMGATGRVSLAVIETDTQADEALLAGARGLIFRDASPERMEAALRAVAQGLFVLDEGLSRRLRIRPPSSRLESLTPRELEVLELLAQGLSNKRIGERLGISEHTAKFHVNSILGKLGARTRAEAIVRAAKQGLLMI